MCRIDDTDGEPEFVIKVVEEGLKDLVLRDKSAKGELINGVFTLTVNETGTGTWSKWVVRNCVEAFTLHLNQDRAEALCPLLF